MPVISDKIIYNFMYYFIIRNTPGIHSKRIFFVSARNSPSACRVIGFDNETYILSYSLIEKQRNFSCFPMIRNGKTKNVLHTGISCTVQRDNLPSFIFAFGVIGTPPPSAFAFIDAEKTSWLYPTVDPSSRVNEYIKKVKALFVIGIGHKLSDGISQDGRAFDYDDWNLNGDLFVYNDLLDNALELSSMGIRVDKEAIINQAILSSNEDKLNLEYQQKIINEEVPFTLGGGIGQSRLCMFFLNKLHVGEVQSSYWDDSTREFFLSKGITLL